MHVRQEVVSIHSATCNNELLRTLPNWELARLRYQLERVPLKKRQVLQERNVPVAHAYFIERGVGSMMSRIGRDAGGLEVALLGRSDVVGIPIVLGTMRSPHRCIMHVPGEAFRIAAGTLQQMMEELPTLRLLLSYYVQAFLVQTTQLVACNTCHTLRERLARWLVLAHERLATVQEIAVTHSMLGRALGARRAGITTALGQFENSGYLQRARGHIVIKDRAGLEKVSCPCWKTILAEHSHLISHAEANPRTLPIRSAG
jgi:CRP-like cAMP-binding protein